MEFIIGGILLGVLLWIGWQIAPILIPFIIALFVLTLIIKFGYHILILLTQLGENLGNFADLINKKVRQFFAKKIVIVEPDEELRLLYWTKLPKLFEQEIFFLSSNGRQAMNFIKKNKVKLIISEIIMPNVDGFELLSYTKENKPNIPFIFLANLDHDKVQKEAKKKGVDLFLSKKNMTIKELQKEILKSLASKENSADINL